MNSLKHEVAATFLSLFGALFVWSSWAAQRGAPAPHLAFLHPKPAPMQVMTPEEKLKASQALSQALRDPTAITKKDMETARRAFGKDGERMLKLLRQASR